MYVDIFGAFDFSRPQVEVNEICDEAMEVLHPIKSEQMVRVHSARTKVDDKLNAYFMEKTSTDRHWITEWLRQLNDNLVKGYKRDGSGKFVISQGRVLGIIQLFMMRLHEDLVGDNRTVDDVLKELKSVIE